MNISANLPNSVHGMRFVKNHHFVELQDVDGNKIVLDATTILLGDCTACAQRVAAFTNMGAMACTHCGEAVKWRYVKPQLAFVAENESQFLGWDTEKKEE